MPTPESEKNTIELHKLHVGKGHEVIKFDGSDKEQIEKANATITDLLRQGYFITVKNAKGEDRKIKKFDPKINSYIIAGVPDEVMELTSKNKVITATPPVAGG